MQNSFTCFSSDYNLKAARLYFSEQRMRDNVVSFDVMFNIDQNWQKLTVLQILKWLGLSQGDIY